MKRLIKYIFTILLFVLAFFVVAWFFSTREVDTYTSPTTPVEVIYPSMRNIKESYTVTGYIEAEAMIPVVPFVSGTITEYYAENDMAVKKDQILAVIDTEPYELQLNQAKAAYLAYESTFQRVSSLYEKGAATKQNYDEVKAQRDAGKAQYDLAQLQLSYCYVDAPADGTILISNGAVGSVGTPDNPLAVIADLDKLIVNVKVPEKYYHDIDGNKRNLNIKVTRKTDGREYSSSASLVSISPYIDPGSKNFTVKVKLDGDTSLFRPGMMVEVEIVYREEEVLSLPQSVKKLDGSVYIVEKDSEGETRAEFLTLPSILENDDFFQVEEKYRDTMFISRGQTMVLDGQSVNVTEGY